MMDSATAAQHRNELYGLFDQLRAKQGDVLLRDCSGATAWPSRGVYFFFEDGEVRVDGHPRVVRVGTHALRAGSKSSLWGRLRQHRGNADGLGGNHRGSVFRLHVGAALLASGRSSLAPNTWAQGSKASVEVKATERQVESAVSERIGAMRVLWLSVDDEPGPDSQRGFIETNTIRLLSLAGHAGAQADRPSAQWLGLSSPNSAVNTSGLWNVRETTGGYNPEVLSVFRRFAERT